VTLSSRSIIKVGFLIFSVILISSSCSSSNSDVENAIIHGTIQYPFAQTDPLGREKSEDKFIIRSAVGNSEYSIEIPGGAREFDVEIPLAAIHGDNANLVNGLPNDLSKPNNTDRELVNALPSLSKKRPTDTAMMDGAFGVGEKDGPRQAPSYSLGISKATRFYKKKQFEYALIEINNMLAFFPNSPKLLKMKGTCLIKMRNLQLAELAWIKALELNPKDKTLQRGVKRLQKRIIAVGKSSQQYSLDKPYDIPTPVGSPSTSTENAIGH
jgi:tetratricopeptide (TPR) repeat protein